MTRKGNKIVTTTIAASMLINNSGIVVVASEFIGDKVEASDENLQNSETDIVDGEQIKEEEGILGDSVPESDNTSGDYLSEDGSVSNNIIPDINLRRGINAALGKVDLESPVSKAELSTLKTLEVTDSNIVDLTGLEYGVNLEKVDLRKNNISNLTPIAKLSKLKKLFLSENNLEDIEPLKDLKSIQELRLKGNPISNISSLSELPELTYLDISQCNIKNISELKKLTNLKTFHATNQKITLDTQYIVKNKVTIPNMVIGIDGTKVVPVKDLISMSGIYSEGAIIWDDLPNKNQSLSFVFDEEVPVGDTEGVFSGSVYVPIEANNNASIEAKANVAIEDKALLAGINQALGKSNLASAVTESELASLTNLVVTGKGVKSLKGLEYAVGLTRLELTNNQITDVSPLKNLKNLKTLYLNKNNISEINNLRYLTNLTYLSIGDNNIVNIAPIRNMKKLKYLRVYRNKISSLEDISNITTIESLHAYENRLTTVSDIVSLVNLKELSIGDNYITSVSGLEKLTNLENLRIYRNKIKSISSLKTLTKLTHIDFEGCSISNISVLKSMPNLTTAVMNDQEIIVDPYYYSSSTLREGKIVKGVNSEYLNPTSISNSGVVEGNEVVWTGLANKDQTLSYKFSKKYTTNFPGAETTAFSGTVKKPVKVSKTITIKDANLKKGINKALGKSNLDAAITRQEIESLKVLEVKGGSTSSEKIKDLTGLEYAVNLTTLRLEGNAIVDVTPIKNLTKLKTLQLNQNNITDITPLAGLINLGYLSIGGNQVKDISALGGMILLHDLRIYRNNISNISILQNLTGLTRLDVYENNITNIDGLEKLQNLNKLSIGDNPVEKISKLNKLVKLEDLRMYRTNVSDISNLKPLIKLKYFDFSECHISNISVLDEMTLLETAIMDSQTIELSTSDFENSSYSIENFIKGKNGGELIDPSWISPGGKYTKPTIRWSGLSLVNQKLEFTFSKDYGYGGSSTSYSGRVTKQIEINNYINIPDVKLLNEINKVLGKSNLSEKVRLKEILTIDVLEVANKGIKDLTGLEYAANLVRLNLNGNPITKITPITKLTKLSYLDISNCGIKTLSGFDGMTGLQTLLAENNYISSFSQLLNLKKLTTLNLNKNSIINLSGITGLNYMQNLSLANQRYTNTNVIQSNGRGEVNIKNPFIGEDGAPIKPVTTDSNGSFNSQNNEIIWIGQVDGKVSVPINATKTITVNGKSVVYSGTVYQEAQITLAILDIIVPQSIPISMNKSGVLSVPGSVRVENNSPFDAKVTNINVVPKDNWSIVNYSKEFQETQVNKKEFGMTIKGTDVYSNNGLLQFNNLFINPYGYVDIDYKMKMSTQLDIVTAKNIADITFIVSKK